MNVRTTVGLALFGVAAVVSFFLNRADDDDGPRDEAGLTEGYYLEGVSLTGTDALGKVKYTLRADRADHHPKDGSIELNNLSLDYGSSESPWNMSARHGYMPQTGNEITLRGAVEIHSDYLNESEHTIISSESLRVDIDGQTADTADAVRVEMGRGSIEGIGLEVDFANEQVSILSDIRGVFDPPPQ